MERAKVSCGGYPRGVEGWIKFGPALQYALFGQSAENKCLEVLGHWVIGAAAVHHQCALWTAELGGEGPWGIRAHCTGHSLVTGAVASSACPFCAKGLRMKCFASCRLHNAQISWS